MPKGRKAKPPSRAKAEQGVATYFLAKHSGLFRPGAATILANSPMMAKPKLTLPARPKYTGLGGPGGGSGSSTAGNIAPSGSVLISGTATQSQTLTASNTLSDPNGMGPVSYQWKRDGTVIAGATGLTYLLAAADVGHTISVTGSYVDGLGTTESVTSLPTAVVAAAALWATFDGVAVNTTVSGGGLVATHNNSTLGGARSASSKNSGNYYYELTFTNLNGTNSGAEILREDTTYTAGSPLETDVILGLLPPTDVNVGLILANSGNTGQKIGAMGPATTTIGIAVNFAFTVSWWRICPAGPWNGLPNPGTTNPVPAASGGVNGITIGGAVSGGLKATPTCLFAGDATETCTANFGQSAFVGVVPTGYTPGWPK